MPIRVCKYKLDHFQAFGMIFGVKRILGLPWKTPKLNKFGINYFGILGIFIIGQIMCITIVYPLCTLKIWVSTTSFLSQSEWIFFYSDQTQKILQIFNHWNLLFCQQFPDALQIWTEGCKIVFRDYGLLVTPYFSWVCSCCTNMQ